MSQTVFSSSFLVIVVLSFLLLGNRLVSYLKDNYPNLDGGVGASITGFTCIILALAASLLITFIHHWVSHR